MTVYNLSQLFSNSYLLGGSPCSGKSTLAERLKDEFHFQYYKVDDHQDSHLKRCMLERHPTMYRYASMSWNERWGRPVSVQVQEVFAICRERFEMILQDLEQYDPAKPLILEGTALLPELLEAHRISPEHVVYFVPTKEFQRRLYSRRPWIKDILKECEYPERAFENWMLRDQAFGRKILRQAMERNYRTILVDGGQTVDELYNEVKGMLSNTSKEL